MQIRYTVPFIKQGVSECAQSSATEILQYLGIKKTLEEVKTEVPVYISKKGIPLGTSLGHLAGYLIDLGLDVTLHVADIEIFDQSWKGKSSLEISELLRKREIYFSHARYEREAIELVFDGYITFLEKGGKINFPIISEEFLMEKIKEGPFLALVSYNFLNQVAKYRFNKEKNIAEQDSIQGTPSAHVVVVAGYEEGKFLLLDPDFEFGGERWVNTDRFVGAIYLAETDFDSFIVTVRKR